MCLFELAEDETYKTRAAEKLHIRSRVDIVRYAIQCGWLSEDAPEPLLVTEGRSS